MNLQPSNKKDLRGRPKGSFGKKTKEVKEDQVEDLASEFLTLEEISTLLDISTDTLERRFMAAVERGRIKAGGSLKRLQWTSAKSGSIPMQIWLGKVYLKQRAPEDDDFDEERKKYLKDLKDILEKERNPIKNE